MDLSKAFDALPRGFMIAKLSAYGISESACKFISGYLSSRQQRERFEVTMENSSTINMGSLKVLYKDPSFFNIFQNDLFYFLGSLCILYNYANDNTLSNSE